MKIGLFTELYPPSIGGQEIRFQQLARALHTRGHDVSIFTIDHRGDLPHFELDDGIAIYRHPSDPNYMRPQNRLRRSLKTMLRYSIWSRTAIRMHHLDVKIYNQWPLLHIPLATMTRGITVIDWCELRSGPFWSLIQNIFPHFGHLNIAVSNDVTRKLSRHAPNIFCVPSGIRLSEYKNFPRQRRSGLLYIGRISRHKNLPLLIQAFESLFMQGYRGGLTIAGSGPELPAITALCESSPAKSQIELLGHVTDAQKITLLGSAEFLIITSRREGFPRVVAEAIASGTPVITAEYPDNGTASIVNEYHCGRVVDPDPDAIAKAVLDCLENWETLSSAAAQGSGALDWDNLISQFESKIEGIRS